MAIDFDAIRRKLNKLSGKGPRNSRWSPTDDEEATLRIVAFPDNDGQPFKERWFYYNIGDNPGLLAPYQFGKPDPIQELINKLRDEGSKESMELAKKLYPKMRTYAAVVVRGEEEEGVKLYGFGKTVYQSLLNIMLDEDYGDITDPETGRDIKVLRTKPPGRSWPTTEVRPRGKATKLAESAEQAKEFMSNIPDLDEMYTCKSYEELEKIVNDWLNPDDDTDGTSRGGSSDEGSSSDDSAGSTKYGSLDEAFADLENL